MKTKRKAESIKTKYLSYCWLKSSSYGFLSLSLRPMVGTNSFRDSKIRVKKGEARLDVYEMKNHKVKIDVKFRGSIPKEVKSALKSALKKIPRKF